MVESLHNNVLTEKWTRKRRKLIGIMTEKIKIEIESNKRKMRQDKTSINMKICIVYTRHNIGCSCGVK